MKNDRNVDKMAGLLDRDLNRDGNLTELKRLSRIQDAIEKADRRYDPVRDEWY